MIAINIEELKILITADIARATAPVRQLKAELNSVKNVNVKVGASKSSAFTAQMANMQGAIQQVKQDGFGIGDAIATGLSSRIPEALSASFAGFGAFSKSLKGSGGGPAAFFASLGDASETLGKTALADKLIDVSGAITGVSEAVGGGGGVAAALGGLGSSFSALLAPIAAVIAALAALAVMLAPIIAMFATIAIGKAIDAWTAKAVQFDSAVTNLNATLGDSGDLMQDWIDKSAMGLGMSTSVAQSAASQLSILTKSFTNSTRDNAIATANLLNSAAIVASKTGRTTQDVMERFRSGMLGNTESIEDIGIQVGQKALEQTDAYKKLGVAYDDLAPKQKQYLYYMAIIEGTNKNYGDSVANGPALRSAQFKAALDNLQLALSQAFLPIATMILPVITKMVIYLGAAINFVSWLMSALSSVPPIAGFAAGALGTLAVAVGILTGNVWLAAAGVIALISSIAILFGQKAKLADDGAKSTKAMAGNISTAGAGAGKVAKGLGSAAKSAKQIRKSLAGFDEINNLGPKPDAAASGGGGGGAGGGGIGGGALPDLGGAMPDVLSNLPTVEEVLAKMKAWAKKVWKKWSAFWGKYLGEPIGNIIGWLLYDLPYAFGEAWKAFKEGIKKIPEAWDKAWAAFKEGIKKIGPAFKEAWEAIKTAFAPMGQWFKDKFNAARDNMKLAFAATGAYFAARYVDIKNAMTNVKTWFSDKFKGAYSSMKDAFSGTGKFFDGLWSTIKSKFSKIGSTVGSAIGGAAKTVINSVLSRAESTINRMVTIINNAVRVIRRIPGLGGVPFLATVSVPRLARGGVVGSGQIYQAGERGKEAIVPLENNTEWLGKVAGMLAGQLGSGMNDRPLTVVLQVGETEFGRVSCNSINALIRQEGAIPLAI